MEHSSFDRLTRALSGGTIRRRGLLAAITVVVAALNEPDVDAARRASRRREKLACRNAGSLCTTDDQCCSGNCVEKDEAQGGGFRCARAHRNKRNDKRRGDDGPTPAIVPNGERCTPIDQCEDPAATCTSYLNNTPTGTYCVLPNGSVCAASADCQGNLCNYCSCCPYSGTSGMLEELGSDGSGPDQFSNIRGLAITSDGLQMLVVDSGNSRVDLWTRPDRCGRWTASRTFDACGDDTLSGPAGIAITSDGLTALVGDEYNNRVCIYRRTAGNIDWAYVSTFGESGTSPGQFETIRALALSPDDLTLAVSQSGVVDNVAVFSRATLSSDSWTSQGFFGESGSASDQLDAPWGLTFTSDGLGVYIADSGNNRIAVWTRTSVTSWTFSFASVWTPGTGSASGTLNQPSDVVLRDDDLTMDVSNWNNLYLDTMSRTSTSSTEWSLENSYNTTSVSSFFVDDGLTYTGEDNDTVRIYGPLCITS